MASIRFVAMHKAHTTENRATWRVSARRGSLSTVLWAFGLATTLLLVGLWGRAVTNDQSTIKDSARSVITSEIAVDRIYGWIEEGAASSGDFDPTTTQLVMSELSQHPEVEAAVDSLVDQFVAALFVENGVDVTIEVTDALVPVIPLIASSFAARGERIDEEAIVAALMEVEDVDLGAGDVAFIARTVNDARSLLSVIVVLAALTLALTGSAAIWLSSDRLAMARTLATRVVLSALSFAVLFRTAAWVLDPTGGGSPVAEGGSILLESNAQVFLFTAAVGGVVGAIVGWYLWRARRRSAAQISTSVSDADARELVRS